MSLTGISRTAEYGSTEDGCQSRSWSAEHGKCIFSLVPFAPENLVSRDGFGRLLQRQPGHSPHLDCKSGAYSRDSSRFPWRRASIHLYRHTLEFNGSRHCVPMVFHCRESAGTEPVVLKALLRVRESSDHGPIFVRLSFSTPTIQY